ncbi:MAG: hypothetical protein JWN48_2387, partial [Myxococcaceae bacterium]|nr:hypothetical protein [Myxococcaceae bacterium]
MNPMRLILGLLFFLSVSRLAHAEDRSSTQTHAPRFSDQGRTMVAGAVGGHWARSGGPRDAWAVSIKPSVAYFVRDRIGFGLMPGYSTGTQGSLYGDDRFHQG